MYDLDDTIAAVSSAGMGGRAIVRITGGRTVEVCKRIFRPGIMPKKAGLYSVYAAIDDQLRVEAALYLFLGPYSYTGEDVAEIHLRANSAVIEVLMGNLSGMGVRGAGPGEFTARAYLNGKIDLAQAEAVNEIIVSSNTFQLAAAEKLLGGRLSEAARGVCSEIMDCLGLIEAGLDFSGEDIEFITPQEALDRLAGVKGRLEEMLAGGIGYESVIDLPAVGIAGAPNAGKSSLVNKLLGRQRSIVSHERKTTRDVLTGVLTLAHCRCVLFDCAGLICEPEGILDELAQAAAVEALRNSCIVVFCVDAAKMDWSEDVSIRRAVESEAVAPAAMKCDLLGDEAMGQRLGELEAVFGAEFLPVSSESEAGIERLREEIDRRITAAAAGSKTGVPFAENGLPGLALTARHRQAVSEAIENISEAAKELDQGGAEVTAMMLRAAWQRVSSIEQPLSTDLDEQILEKIFSRFCIGK